MKRLFLLPLLALLTAIGVKAQSDDLSQPLVYGVAFYNLENLFDTINANGKYDLEYSPKGAKAWDSEKYWSKINNLAYCISRMTTRSTPLFSTSAIPMTAGPSGVLRVVIREMQ